MEIKCSFKELLDINDPRIIANPDNPNDHSEDQISNFANVLKYQGQRKPITISNLTGFIVTGHGTLMAAKKAGAKKIAVDFQDFENEAQEYAHVVADNGIALQSELNKGMIASKIVDFGPDFNVEMLGLDGFKLDYSEIDFPELPDGDKSEIEQITFTLHRSQKETVDAAIKKAKPLVPDNESLNENSNGNAIALICELYLNND